MWLERAVVHALVFHNMNSNKATKANKMSSMRRVKVVNWLNLWRPFNRMNAAVNFHLFLTFASIRVEEKKKNFSNSKFFQSFAWPFCCSLCAGDDEMKVKTSEKKREVDFNATLLSLFFSFFINSDGKVKSFLNLSRHACANTRKINT